jgi:phosphoglycerol transferase MdoB-like AlkP superfamily enzyme
LNVNKDNPLKKHLSPYYPIIVYFLLSLLFLSLSRIAWIILYHQRIPGVTGVFKILVYGLRIDTVLGAYAVALPVLLTPFFEGYRMTHKAYSRFLSIWFTAWSVVVVVMETVTPGYIKEYDVRPNRLFVEYLTYPQELINMLLKGYIVHVVLGLCALGVTAFAGFRFFRKLTETPSEWTFMKKLAVFPVLAVLVFIGARSSFGHRPVNPSNVAFSTDSLVNDLALNSTYSVLYAVYMLKDEADAGKIYGRMDEKTMMDIVRKNITREPGAFKNPEIPTLHHLEPTGNPGKPLNLTIIMEESFGAEFVESLGGVSVTPNLERLKNEGLWFDNLYAIGTRSVMGIEALVSGFPPSPARSVVKLGKAQKNFFTLAQLLAQRGYVTRFIYGGDSNFDNMKGFFLGNGFQEVIDEKDYDHPKFKGSWGVSDQDLFDKAHEACLKENGKPFFNLIFTSSNHPPFEFPDNAIDLYEQPKATVNNAVKYADFALNEFFDNAKKSPYWKDTVFLVVADHNSHVAGESLVPVPRFKIPALIIGPGVKPAVYKRLASQIDLPVTLLSVMGISCDIPMIGRDLTNINSGLEPRAILQFYKNQAYMTDRQVTILQPGEKVEGYTYSGLKLTPAELDKDQAETALAHALWTSWTYSHMTYRLP